MAQKELLLKSAIQASIDAHQAAIDDLQTNDQQVQDAISEALTQSDVDPGYVSYTVGSLPDSTGAATGTIGAYFKTGGILQKLEWDGAAWQEIGLPLVTPDGSLIDSGAFKNRNVHIVSGVIRYYAAAGGWDLLENHEANPHPSINISSVLSTTDYIDINFNNAGFGAGTAADIEVGSFIIAPDETLASEGLLCGSSVNFERARIELYKGPLSDYISYDGSTWSAASGRFDTLTWNTDHLEISRVRDNGVVNSIYPQLTPRETPYNVTLGSVQQSGTIEIYFYDAGGTLVTAPDANMKFFINDPNGASKVDPNGGFDDMYGNLWFWGWLSSGHA